MTFIRRFTDRKVSTYIRTSHAVHFITGRLQPFIGFIAGNGTPGTVTETDEIWRVGEGAT